MCVRKEWRRLVRIGVIFFKREGWKIIEFQWWWNFKLLCCQTCCFDIYLGQQSEGLKKRVLKPDFLFIFSTKNLSEEENDLSGFSGARMLPSRHDDLGKNRGVLGKWKEMAVSFQKKKKMFQQISNRDWQLCRATGSASSLLIRTPGTSSASSSSTSPLPSSSSSTGSGPTPWDLFQTGAALLHPILFREGWFPGKCIHVKFFLFQFPYVLWLHGAHGWSCCHGHHKGIDCHTGWIL